MKTNRYEYIPRGHKPKFFRGKQINDEINSKVSRIDILLQRMAHLTQVALLVLGVLGYIFTVRPAFQNQILQEETSRLELEKRSLQKDIAKHKQKTIQLDKKKAFLEKELVAKSNQLDEIHLQIEKAKSDALNAKNKTVILEKVLRNAAKKIDRSSWEILKLEFKTISRLTIYNLAIQQSADIKSVDDRAFFFQLLNDWVSPADILYAAVTNASRKNMNTNTIPDSFYQTLLSHIKESQSKYICKKPGLTELKNNYDNEIIVQKNLYKTVSNKNINSSMKNMTDIINTTSDNFEKYIKNDITYKVRSDYNAKINEIKINCMLSAINEISSFMDSKTEE
ncbi:TPA: hypothetical protein RQM99_000756 [Aeromonas dhakensis]|nr:hypothetical protein [Aeromonas dhakensis]